MDCFVAFAPRNDGAGSISLYDFRRTVSCLRRAAAAIRLAVHSLQTNERTLIRKQADPWFESDRTIVGQPIDDATAAQALAA